jgi:tetratricopeptide (TPR) repeat protein
MDTLPLAGPDGHAQAALMVARAAVATATPGSGEQAAARVRLYELLQQALEEDPDDNGEPTGLQDESIATGRALLTAEIGTDARRLVEVSLCVDLLHRYRRLGTPAVDDLEQAIQLARTRVEAADEATWATDRLNLASALLTSWEDRDRIDHLEEVIGLLSTALSSDGVEPEGRALLAVNLAAAFGKRYDLSRQPADLEQAIQVARIALSGPDPAVVATAKVNLASELLTAHSTGVGALDPLAEAASLIDEVIAAGSDSGVPAGWWYTAAQVRMAQFDHDGNGDHLELADAALAKALAALPRDSPWQVSYLAAAATLAFTRYSLAGDRGHLQEAISIAQRAQSFSGISGQDLGILANQACLAVTERFELDGNQEDLDHAISLAREALAPGTRLDIAISLRINLAHALRSRFEVGHERRDLIEGIAAIAPALRLLPPSPERASALGVAGTLYETKALTAQADGDAGIAQSDLDLSIRYGREALSLTQKESTDYVIYQMNLASRLSSRAEVTGSYQDHDEAISHYEAALGAASGNPAAAARISYALGCHYASRSQRPDQPGNRADLQRACDLWDDSLAVGEPFISQFAGQRLGGIAFQIGEWDKCEQALAFSLDAARVLTARRPRLGDRERARFTVQGTSATAALAAVRAGSPERAAVHLEQGAATLLAEAAGHPADKVIFPDIVQAARRLGGPLVYWAATDDAGISLIVTPDGTVTPVSLDVTTAEASAVTDSLRTAFDDSTGDQGMQLARWNSAVMETARWTWERLVWKVADAVGSPETMGLIPVGRLAALPLTTAKAQGTTALYERTIPRVLPNARSAGSPSPWPARPRAAVICDAGGRDEHLPAIEAEARRVAACYAQAGQIIAESAAGATPPRRILRRVGSGPVPASSEAAEEFLGCLRGADVAHVACHFQLEFTDPLSSILRFKSGIRLAELFERALPAPSHLVLSACDSGLAGTRLPDEAIGPAPLLLALGARSVLAALWPLDDATTPGFMAEYHRRLSSGQEPATALALTQRAASQTIPMAVWPAFIHVGP